MKRLEAAEWAAVLGIVAAILLFLAITTPQVEAQPSPRLSPLPLSVHAYNGHVWLEDPGFLPIHHPDCICPEGEGASWYPQEGP